MRRLLIAFGLACALFPAISQAQDEPRMIGGDAVPPTRWPMVAAVLYGGVPGCGATVIASEWVLTAAHCVVQDGRTLPASTLSVQLGTERPDSGNGQVVAVTDIVVHQDYGTASPGGGNDGNFTYFVNDIALLRLARPVAPAPAALVGPNRAATLGAAGKPALVAGWAATAPASTQATSLFLRLVDLEVSGDAPCAAKVAPNAYLPGMLCAAPKPAADQAVDAACTTDAGSPLFLANGRGGFALAGVVSATGTDCTRAAPLIATRITTYLDWLAQRVPGLIVDDSPIESGFWSLDNAGGAAAAIEIQGGRLLLGLMLYDKAGSPTWYFAKGPFAGMGSFTATLDAFADGSDMLYAAGPRQYRQLASPGSVTLAFGGADRGTLAVGDRRWTMRRTTWTTGRPAPAAGLPETGWYWSRRDPGRFWFVEGQGDRMMVADFAYGTVRIDDHFPARWTVAQGTAAKVGTAAVMSAPVFACVGGQGLDTPSGTATCGDTDFALSLTFPGVFTGWLIPGGQRAVAVGRYIAP